MTAWRARESEAGLPTPAAYYRPARAQALRLQAARLARWHKRDRLARLIAALLSGAGLSTALVAGLEPAAMLLLLLGVLLAAAIPRTLSHRIARLEAEAIALEQEHEARYGEASREER